MFTSAHELSKHSNRAKDWWILDKAFKLREITSLLVMRGRLQSNEADCIHLNARFTLGASCTPHINTVPHDGQIKSLWVAIVSQNHMRQQLMGMLESREWRFVRGQNTHACTHTRTKKSNVFVSFSQKIIYYKINAKI